MEIIKPGRLPEDKEAEWACSRCETVIRSKVSEGKVCRDQRDGDYVTTVCPVCKHPNHISFRKFS